MPILLPVTELEPGMRLSNSFEMNGRVMLASGKHLNKADLDILRRKYPNVIVKIGDPILDELTEFQDDTYERDVARKCQARVAKCVTAVGGKLTNRASISGKDFRQMELAVHDVMKFLSDNPVSSALLTRSIKDGSYLAEHSAAVFYLAMVMGSTIKNYIARERLTRTSARDISGKTVFDLAPLGLGAMFMDIGMYPLESLYDNPDQPLTDEQRQQILDHPEVGADLLPESFPAAARVVVRCHHENYDGTGYPGGVDYNRQHIFTRIIRICDSYHAATSQQVFREAKSEARVLWEMVQGAYARFYDPLLVRMFARLIQPFPIGAKVRLSDGRYGVVVRFNKRDPFQPHVIVAFDAENQRIPNHLLNPPFCLEDEPDLNIVAFGDEDLSYLHDGSTGSISDALADTDHLAATEGGENAGTPKRDSLYAASVA